MISNKCKYAVRTVLFLAVNRDEQHKIRISELAEELNIPTPYLGKILQEMVPKSIVSSTKGPNGGFFLTEKNLKTPLIKIIEAIDGLGFFEQCGLGLDHCSDDHPCPIHDDFKVARNHLKNTFSNKTVQELATEITEHNFFLVG